MEHHYGTASTEHASLYLKKLCRHFGHKVEAEFDDHQGRIQFPFGSCELTADATTLQLHCQADTDQMATLLSLPARCSGSAANATDNEWPAGAP